MAEFNLLDLEDEYLVPETGVSNYRNNHTNDERSFHGSLLHDDHKTNSVKAYLNQVADGRVLLKIYEHSKHFQNADRRCLVRVLISHEIDLQLNNKNDQQNLLLNIAPAQFLKLAKEIQEIFPTERSNIYYSPYCKVKNKKILASGKLLDHFRYLKSRLVEANVVLRKRIWPAEDDEALTKNINDLDSLKEKDEWLKCNIEPYDQVIQYWEDTWQYRWNVLLKSTPSIPVYDYMHRYRCLTMSMGIELLTNDFDQVKPLASINARIRWEKLRPKLFSYMLSNNNLKSVVSVLLRNVDITALSAVEQDDVIIQLLPKLLRPPANKRKINYQTIKKPSLAEIESSFLVKVQNTADIQTVLDEKRNQGAENCEAIQPFLLFVGGSNGSHQFSAYYVIADDIRYQLYSSYEALNFAFQLFFAVDISYPAYSQHIWQLVQRLVYEIEIAGDKYGVQLNTLLVDLHVPSL